MTHEASHSTLLLIAQVIALSDGSISEEEEKMILGLPDQLGLKAVPRITQENLPKLSNLGKQLSSHGDRCLAARIAGLVAGVSRNPEDQLDINADERSAYRELITTLKLEESELEEIEFSVRKQLSESRSLLQSIGDALFGKDNWPDEALLSMNLDISEHI
tara:strand:+ start:78 stop:560 length:483 start_codon:yes stop_codon:yes gene_type:complete